jgi:hypothetical protein
MSRRSERGDATRPARTASSRCVFLHAIERDPARRYATADAFRDDLERWLAGRLPHAARLGRVGRAARHVRVFARVHRAALLLAAVGLAGIGGTAWAAMRPDDLEVVVIGEGRDGRLDVKSRAKQFLFAVGMTTDSSGVRFVVPELLRIGDAPPQLGPEIAPNVSCQVEIVPTPFARSGQIDRHGLVGVTRSKAASWQALQEAALSWATREKRLLTEEEYRKLYAELHAPGRGPEPFDDLELDEILRPVAPAPK